MSQEIELKLAVPQALINTVKHHPFWQSYSASAPKTVQLGNIYFDTADLKLNQEKVALRIREIDGEFIQTLKTKGTSHQGITRRGEWEWQLSSPELDLTLLKPVWPESLGAINAEQLIPLFSTNFHRTKWLLTCEAPYAKIEAALDVGEVRSGNKSSPISELELELLEGDEKALEVIAQKLNSELNLKPSDESKAEKGFNLLVSSRS
ncbi:CYTH domain-containing protein [uncultured Endozoicomonas sp.]|uniref:CYTH domain-containing protein n=1 Tax=uncultured Endozoicomonas sp. TaxID=432652 RepID=UPI00262E9926|nr:CYTH domain-containing protein [uncultured Endozoicomonas sp.]